MSDGTTFNSKAVVGTTGLLLLVAPFCYARANEQQRPSASVATPPVAEPKAAISAGEPILEVDPGSGAASLYFPLGPGIGPGGMRYTPALVGRMAPQVGEHPNSRGGGDGIALLAASGFELSPGVLDLLIPANMRDPVDLSRLARWTYPDGSGGCTTPWNWPENQDPWAIMATYGYGPSIEVGQMPGGYDRIPAPFLARGDAGERVLGCVEERRFPTVTVSPLTGNRMPGPLQIPSCVFIRRGDVGYEYRFAGTWKSKDQESLFGHYRLAAIRSLDGETITFKYGSNGIDFMATSADEKVIVSLEAVESARPVLSLFDATLTMEGSAPVESFCDLGLRLSVTHLAGESISQKAVINAVCPSNWLSSGQSLAARLDCALGEDGSPVDSIRSHLQVTGIGGPTDPQSILFDYGKAPALAHPGSAGTRTFAPTVLQGLTFNGTRFLLNWRGYPTPKADSPAAAWAFALDSITERMGDAVDGRVVYRRAAVEEPTRAVLKDGGTLTEEEIPTYRQARHFSSLEGPCRTYVRDRWAFGRSVARDHDSELSSPVPYHGEQDIPTFVLDPKALDLIPVSGQLTRWMNQRDPSDIHRSPFGLRGGGGRGSKGGGGCGSSTGTAPSRAEGPSGGGKSTVGIRAFDRAHSQPHDSIRAANDRGRESADSRVQGAFLNSVGQATVFGAAGGARATGPCGAVGGAIVAGVGAMGSATVKEGIALREAYSQNKEDHAANERTIRRWESSGCEGVPPEIRYGR